MKNIDQRIDSIFSKADKHFAKKKKIQKAVFSAGAIAVCLAVVGVPSMNNRLISRLSGDSITNELQSGGKEYGTDAVGDNGGSAGTATDTIPAPAIDTVPQPEIAPAMGNVMISSNLSNAFEKSENPEEVFAVLVTYLYISPDESYVYKGKTMSQYEEAASKEAMKYEQMSWLLKSGYDNAYDTPAYVPGGQGAAAPDSYGYRDILEQIDEELTARYVINGEMQYDKLNNDLAEQQKIFNEAITARNEAAEDYNKKELQRQAEYFKGLGFNAQIIDNTLVLFATRPQIEGYVCPEDRAYIFSLKIASNEAEITIPSGVIVGEASNSIDPDTGVGYSPEIREGYTEPYYVNPADAVYPKIEGSAPTSYANPQ